MAKSLPLIACSLGPHDQQTRLAEWRSLLAAATARVDVAGGIGYVFARDDGLWERLRALAVEESLCCPFLRFDIEEVAEGVSMTVTSDADADEVLRLVFH
jgi:hypothetical protein